MIRFTIDGHFTKHCDLRHATDNSSKIETGAKKSEMDNFQAELTIADFGFPV